MDGQPIYNQQIAFARVNGFTGNFISNRNLSGSGPGGIVKIAVGTYVFLSAFPLNQSEIEISVTVLGTTAGNRRFPIIDVTNNIITLQLVDAGEDPDDGDFTISVKRIII